MTAPPVALMWTSWHDTQVPISHAHTVVLVCAVVFTVLLFVAVALIPDTRTEDEKRQDEKKAVEKHDDALTPKVDPNEPARWVP
jgi:hypothetical protein